MVMLRIYSLLCGKLLCALIYPEDYHHEKTMSELLIGQHTLYCMYLPVLLSTCSYVGDYEASLRRPVNAELSITLEYSVEQLNALTL